MSVIKVCILAALFLSVLDLISSFLKEYVTITTYRLSVLTTIIWILISVIDVWRK